MLHTSGKNFYLGAKAAVIVVESFEGEAEGVIFVAAFVAEKRGAGIPASEQKITRPCIVEIRYGDATSTDGMVSVTGVDANFVVIVSTRGARVTGTVSDN